jgi:AcrR family transcriptional regulator
MARTSKVVGDRREQIIDAAMQVFSQKGYVRSTNKDIARAANITPGLIYHYFDSKEALLMAVVESRTPLKVIATIPPEILALPPGQFFSFVIRQVLTVVESENFVALFRVVLPEMLNSENPFFAQFAPVLVQRVFGFIGDYLETQMQAGRLRRADTVLNTQILFGSIVGVVLRRQVLHDPIALSYSQEQIVDTITETFLHGLS